MTKLATVHTQLGSRDVYVSERGRIVLPPDHAEIRALHLLSEAPGLEVFDTLLKAWRESISDQANFWMAPAMGIIHERGRQLLREAARRHEVRVVNQPWFSQRRVKSREASLRGRTDAVIWGRCSDLIHRHFPWIKQVKLHRTPHWPPGRFLNFNRDWWNGTHATVLVFTYEWWRTIGRYPEQAVKLLRRKPVIVESVHDGIAAVWRRTTGNNLVRIEVAHYELSEVES